MKTAYKEEQRFDMNAEELEAYNQDLVEFQEASPAPVQKPVKEKKYNWAFFLSSFMLGVGITATAEVPLPLFIGMSVGFLFFVDPIYERVINLFKTKRDR